MYPYDAILGFDWLQTHSPMQCDWENKTLEVCDNGRSIKLQGIQEPPMNISAISATKVFNSAKGNDVWAFVLVDHIPDPSTTTIVAPNTPPESIQTLLTQYRDVFQDPQTLAPTEGL